MGLKSLDEPNMFFAKLYPSSPLSNNTLKTNHLLIQKDSNNLQKLSIPFFLHKLINRITTTITVRIYLLYNCLI